MRFPLQLGTMTRTSKGAGGLGGENPPYKIYPYSTPNHLEGGGGGEINNP